MAWFTEIYPVVVVEDDPEKTFTFTLDYSSMDNMNSENKWLTGSIIVDSVLVDVYWSSALRRKFHSGAIQDGINKMIEDEIDIRKADYVLWMGTTASDGGSWS